MSKRILFVDDDPNILQGLKRLLRPMRQEWDMAFAQSGTEALELLSQTSFDAIVCDMYMPEMDGLQLLAKVREDFPEVVRIMLSGTVDQERIMRSVAPTHQYLSKPCDPEVLRVKLERSFALRDLLSEASLKSVLGKIQWLPSLPILYTELTQALQDPDITMSQVGEIIAKDVAMTANILRLVNSAYFGLPVQVSSPAHAAKLLGLDTIKALVLSFELFSQFEQASVPGISFTSLVAHSQTVGAFAKAICQCKSQEQSVIVDGLLAGLLHDAGKLVLASNFAEQNTQVMKLMQDEALHNWQAEQRVFGASHAEVGAYLLGLWGLPDAIVEALAFHHRPQDHPARTLNAVTAVHVANAFEHELQSEGEFGLKELMREDYLTELGLSDRLPVWRQTCLKLSEKPW